MYTVMFLHLLASFRIDMFKHLNKWRISVNRFWWIWDVKREEDTQKFIFFLYIDWFWLAYPFLLYLSQGFGLRYLFYSVIFRGPLLNPPGHAVCACQILLDVIAYWRFLSIHGILINVSLRHTAYCAFSKANSFLLVLFVFFVFFSWDWILQEFMFIMTLMSEWTAVFFHWLKKAMSYFKKREAYFNYPFNLMFFFVIL